MDSYRRPPAGTAPGGRGTEAPASAGDPGALLRRLIPFPGVTDALAIPPLTLAGNHASNPAAAVTTAVQRAAAEQAVSIVDQAAAILDEETAKGVLAARRSESAGGGSSRSLASGDSVGSALRSGAAGAEPMLRQVHQLIDMLAAAWPDQNLTPVSAPSALAPLSVLASSGTGLSPRRETCAEGIAELAPHATVKPGQRATIVMALRNNESRAVQVTPVATDLIGSCGGRIPSSVLELSPADVRLEPQEEREVNISLVVPGDAAPGCYSGLLVATGVDYLRAAIVVTVA